MPAGGCVFFEREVGSDDEPDAMPENARALDMAGQVWKTAEATPVSVPVAWAP
jgi:hypothetical protein